MCWNGDGGRNEGGAWLVEGGALRNVGVALRKVGGAGERVRVIPRVLGFFLSSTPSPTRCWERNEVKAIWWIIRTPILVTISVRPTLPPPGHPLEFPTLGNWAPPVPRDRMRLAQPLSLPAD